MTEAVGKGIAASAGGLLYQKHLVFFRIESGPQYGAVRFVFVYVLQLPSQEPHEGIEPLQTSRRVEQKQIPGVAEAEVCPFVGDNLVFIAVAVRKDDVAHPAERYGGVSCAYEHGMPVESCPFAGAYRSEDFGDGGQHAQQRDRRTAPEEAGDERREERAVFGGYGLVRFRRLWLRERFGCRNRSDTVGSEFVSDRDDGGIGFGTGGLGGKGDESGRNEESEHRRGEEYRPVEAVEGVAAEEEPVKQPECRDTDADLEKIPNERLHGYSFPFSILSINSRSSSTEIFSSRTRVDTAFK